MSTLTNYLKNPDWEAGIYQLSSYEEYAAIPALRSSELKLIGKTPAHYKASKSYPKEITSTQKKAFAKGKAFDMLVLDGQERFVSSTVIEPDMSKNSKAYKKWAAHLPKDVTILTEQEFDFALKMRDAVFNKKRFSDIFSNGTAHRVIVWQDPSTGIWCKAEIDWIQPDGTIVDLKSTASADFWFFQRNARRLNYPHQGAFYLSGLTVLTGQLHERFMLAAVETDPPFESHIFNVGPDMLIKAQVDNENRIETLAKCFETDEWPGYPDEIIDLDSGQYLYDDEYEIYNDEIMEGF